MCVMWQRSRSRDQFFIIVTCIRLSYAICPRSRDLYFQCYDLYMVEMCDFPLDLEIGIFSATGICVRCVIFPTSRDLYLHCHKVFMVDFVTFSHTQIFCNFITMCIGSSCVIPVEYILFLWNAWIQKLMFCPWNIICLFILAWIFQPSSVLDQAQLY